MSEIRYSKEIKGTTANFDRSVKFDYDGGYIGVSQYELGDLIDRILLSPHQAEELIRFIEAKGRDTA